MYRSIRENENEYEQALNEVSKFIEQRRALIPKLKAFPSGEALIEYLQVLSDCCLANIMTVDPNDSGRFGYLQGQYRMLTRILNELESGVEGEDKDA